MADFYRSFVLQAPLLAGVGLDNHFHKVFRLFVSYLLMSFLIPFLKITVHIYKNHNTEQSLTWKAAFKKAGIPKMRFVDRQPPAAIHDANKVKS